jgi:hypothetical protein
MLIVSSVLVVSLQTALENTAHDVRNVSDKHTHFVLVWRMILFVSLVRDKTVLFMAVCIFVFVIFVFCKFSSCFLCELFTSLK